MNQYGEDYIQKVRQDMDGDGRAEKVRYRPFLEYNRSYLFRKRGTLDYFEGKVIKYGGLDILGDGGVERFALIKLKIEGKGVWYKREELITEIQCPSDYEDGY